MSLKDDFIKLGHQLSEEENAAHDLWSWLPSHEEAKKYHGDYVSEFRPETRFVMKEACMYIADLTKEGSANKDNPYYGCPCEYESHPHIYLDEVVSGFKAGKTETELAVDLETEPHIIENMLAFWREQQYKKYE